MMESRKQDGNHAQVSSNETVDFIHYLPDELNLAIFAYLPPADLAKLLQVSKKSKSLAEDSSYWRPMLKQTLQSTYPVEVGQEKDTVKKIVEWSRLSIDELIVTAIQDREAALLILQTPCLADRLTNSDDIRQIGWPHKEAAAIILQSPSLLMKCSIDDLLLLANAHESIARQFLQSKQFTADILMLLNTPENVEQFYKHLLFLGGDPAASLEQFTHDFLNRLAESSCEEHASIALFLLQKKEDIDDQKFTYEVSPHDQLYLCELHSSVAAMLLANPGFRQSLLAHHVDNGMNFGAKYNIFDFIEKHPEYAFWLTDANYYRELVKDFDAVVYANEARFSSLRVAYLSDLQAFICGLITSNVVFASTMLMNRNSVKMYAEDGLLIKILLSVAHHQNLSAKIFKRNDLFTDLTLSDNDTNIVCELAKRQPKLASIIIDNAALFLQLNPDQQDGLLKARSGYEKSRDRAAQDFSQHRLFGLSTPDAIVTQTIHPTFRGSRPGEKK